VRFATLDASMSAAAPATTISEQEANPAGAQVLWTEGHYTVFWSEAGAAGSNRTRMQRFASSGEAVAPAITVRSSAAPATALHAAWDAPRKRALLAIAGSALELLAIHADVADVLASEASSTPLARVDVSANGDGDILLLAAPEGGRISQFRFDAIGKRQAASSLDPAIDFDAEGHASSWASVFADASGLLGRVGPTASPELIFPASPVSVRIAVDSSSRTAALAWFDQYGSDQPASLRVSRYAVGASLSEWVRLAHPLRIADSSPGQVGVASVGEDRLLVVWQSGGGVSAPLNLSLVEQRCD
jgi:hypothetical protein